MEHGNTVDSCTAEATIATTVTFHEAASHPE
jgi:hypothetical protein